MTFPALVASCGCAALALVFATATPAQAVWTQLNPNPAPPGRTGAAYAADGSNLWVHGGGDASGRLGDLWRFDGTTWTNPTPANPPAPRWRHAAAWDMGRSKLVVFGGALTNAGSSRVNETWEWDGNNWTQLFPANSPSARWWHQMAYDRIGINQSGGQGRVLLFGGQDSGSRLSDTWEWDGNNWTPLAPTMIPPARERAAMAANLRTGEIVLFGGNPGGGVELGDTWTWNGQDWRPVTTPTIPYGTGTRNAGMTYDPIRDRTVLFGGITGGVFQTNTWEFDGQDWVDRGASPLATRTFPSMAFVLALGKTVLFSGFGGTGVYYPDTWEYQTSTPASFAVASTGCPGSNNMVPGLSATKLPWIGDTFEVQVTSVAPNAQPFLFTGISSSVWIGGPLPFSLASLGFPNCFLRVSTEVAVPAVTPVQIPVPNNPALIGGTLFVQAITIEPPFQIAMSARGDAVIGAR